MCTQYSILIMDLHCITILSRWDLKYTYSTIRDIYRKKLSLCFKYVHNIHVSESDIVNML